MDVVSGVGVLFHSMSVMGFPLFSWKTAFALLSDPGTSCPWLHVNCLAVDR